MWWPRRKSITDRHEMGTGRERLAQETQEEIDEAGECLSGSFGRNDSGSSWEPQSKQKSASWLKEMQQNCVSGIHFPRKEEKILESKDRKKPTEQVNKESPSSEPFPVCTARPPGRRASHTWEHPRLLCASWGNLTCPELSVWAMKGGCEHLPHGVV